MPEAGRVVPLYEDEPATALDSARHAELLRTVLDWWDAANNQREPLKQEWRREYLMYRSFVAPRKAGDWRHRVFIPISFHVIESQMPKLIAQLPQPIVLPVGPEDVEPARKMEDRLKWAFDQSGLWIELSFAYRSALKYGTGLLKVFPGRREGWQITRSPRYRIETQIQPAQPELDPRTGEPMLDMDGRPLGGGTQELQVEVPELDDDGHQLYDSFREAFTYYEGPVTQFVDIEDIWVAPEATSVEDSRFLIQRFWRELDEIQEKIESGDYALPVGSDINAIYEDREENPALERQGEAGLGSTPDPTREPVEVWEVWTITGRHIVVLNRRLVVRVAENPFAHGEKPFIRVLDHIQENEFYGMGELGPILQIQDAINALWSSRLDNVRIVLQRVFAVNPANLWDQRDLRIAPGKAIRIRSSSGINPADLIFPIDFPDITASAYEEVNELIALVERVLQLTGVSDNQGSSAYNDTATGVAITSENENSRAALKVRMSELTGLVPLARQFGSILQQWTPQEMWIRREGAEGAPEFDMVEDPEGGGMVAVPAIPADIQGQFDFDIEAGSQAQTDSVRKELEMTLFNLFAGRADAEGIPLFHDRELGKDLMRAWGKKDLERLVVDPMEFKIQQMQLQAQAAQMMGPAMGGLAMGAPPPAGGPEQVPAA